MVVQSSPNIPIQPVVSQGLPLKKRRPVTHSSHCTHLPPSAKTFSPLMTACEESETRISKSIIHGHNDLSIFSSIFPIMESSGGKYVIPFGTLLDNCPAVKAHSLIATQAHNGMCICSAVIFKYRCNPWNAVIIDRGADSKEHLRLGETVHEPACRKQAGEKSDTVLAGQIMSISIHSCHFPSRNCSVLGSANYY